MASAGGACADAAAGSASDGTTSALRLALKAFPPVQHAFAYGSGVFRQPGSETLRGAGEGAPLVDLIFAVDDPVSWHAANLARNRAHYSLLGAAGPRAVVAVAEAVGAGVYFNPFVKVGSQTVKYGVIETSRLLHDLQTWDALYVAGRMHKPVATLTADARIATAADANLRAALACALLLLPNRFSEAQLHETLCGLSYTGDVRMAIAEDASKVHRIAQGSAAQLRQLYRGAVARASAWRAALAPGSSSGFWTQNSDECARRELVTQLPPGLLHRLACGLHTPAPPPADPAARRALAQAVAAAPARQALLRGALAATVRASSARQALAGLLTAGLGNAARYVGRKVTKAWLSRTGATGALGA